jgi:unsaturated rhamnogalacturonyl hydrolase
MTDRIFRKLPLLLLAVAMMACAPLAEVPRSPAALPPSSPANWNPDAWAIRMAESVMERSPQLKTRWHYELGTMLTAFQQLYEATGDERYYTFIEQNINQFVEPDGSIRTYTIEEYNLDQVNSGKQLFLLYERTGDERYRIAAQTLRRQLAQHPRTSEDGFWHKLVYPYQMWLDGVYMAGPFYAQYGRVFDEPAAFDDVAHQIALIARHTRDPRTGLFYHAWDETREMSWSDPVTGLSQNFWGRAIGWYAMAIVDVLDFMPEDHRDRAQVIRILQALAEGVAGVQDPVTGTWYQVLDKPNRQENYHEASASAMFVYALAKGARKGYLEPAYMDIARRGFDGIVDQFIQVNEDGLLDMHGIVSVGGLGGRQQRDGSFEYYMSEPLQLNDYKGVGPFIMAGIEIERAARAGR